MKNKFTIENPMPPIWMMYPHISQFSIGWRMGYGEDYKYKFWEWKNSLPESERKQYETMFPAPKTWREYYNEDYHFEDVDDFECEGVELWSKGGKMQYYRTKLIEQFNKGEKPDFEFFWKPENDVINKSCFGQWTFSEFKIDTDIYYYTEQYMMAEKARLFKDKEVLEQIMKAKDPKEMKALGKKVRNFNQDIWDKTKYSIVLNGNYFKFAQNPGMRNFLLATGNKILVEASPLDKIWGIGLSEENSNAMNPNLWRGQNLLGFALMEVRDDLRNVYKNYDKINWEDFNGIDN